MTTKSYIVTKDKAQTLTNKTIDSDSNVIQNLDSGNFKQHTVEEKGQVFGIKDDGFVGLITPASGSYLPLSGGTMNGDINMNSKDINYVKTIKIGSKSLTSSNNYLTWDGNYVINSGNIDTSVFKYNTSTNKLGLVYSYLPRSGGTMTGTLTVPTLYVTGIIADSASAKFKLDHDSTTGAWTLVGDSTSLTSNSTDGLKYNGTSVLIDNGTVMKTSGGTFTGAVSMNGKKITDLATPTNNTDAATKAYVDGKSGGDYLPLAGGTMTGSINMGSKDISNTGTVTATLVKAGNVFSSGSNIKNNSGSLVISNNSENNSITVQGGSSGCGKLEVYGLTNTTNKGGFQLTSNNTTGTTEYKLTGNAAALDWSGDEITGSGGELYIHTKSENPALYLYNEQSNGTAFISSADDTLTGASVMLSSTGQGGTFDINATGSDGEKHLIGNPDGTLTWCDKKVIVEGQYTFDWKQVNFVEDESSGATTYVYAYRNDYMMIVRVSMSVSNDVSGNLLLGVIEGFGIDYDMVSAPHVISAVNVGAGSYADSVCIITIGNDGSVYAHSPHKSLNIYGGEVVIPLKLII